MAGDGEFEVIDGRGAASRQMTRREIVQRLLAGAGAGTAWPLLGLSHPVCEHLASGAAFEEEVKLKAADWKPLFLNAREDETLAALSERIVPGAMKAQVNRFIDLLLSVDTPEHQKGFQASLAAFESESQKRFRKEFPSLDAAQQDGLLADAALHPVKEDSSGSAGEKSSGLGHHFENLKGWISGAYYSSEAGMRELGWTGDYVHERFPGCEHQDGHN